MLAVQRSLDDDGIQESFRSLPKPDSCAEQKIWTIVDDSSPADINVTIATSINIENEILTGLDGV